MKKIFLTLVLLLMTMFNIAFSAELFKIKPLCFDISGSVIFLPVKTNYANSSISSNITYSKLPNVNGAVLEINSATMLPQVENLFFSNGNLKELQITQVTPTTVRVVMYFKDTFSISNLKIGNINNNILISYKSIPPFNMNYYINTYREGVTDKDYKEDLFVNTRIIEKKPVATPSYSSTSKSQMNEINKAFANSNYQSNEVYGSYKVIDVSQANHLRSKYFINNIQANDNLFEISGCGALSLEKPFILNDPLRMIYDMPNTTVSAELHNKEFTLANGDKMRIAQFNPNTTRMVVTSENAPKYIPVYSPDSQSMILTAPQNLMTSHLPSYKTNIVKTTAQKSGDVDSLIFEFDKPLTYSIKRMTDRLYVYFLNAERYNDTNFQAAIKETPYNQLKMHLMKNTGMRLTMHVAGRDKICTYLSPDGKVFKLSSNKEIVEPPTAEGELQKVKKREGVITSRPTHKKKKEMPVIVIDAGHGGKDCGALSGTILEKDITLDVSDRLQSILQKKGYKVYMTRTNDTYITLEDRTIFTEEINPAVFVSVHVNSCNMSSPQGIETHYYHENSLGLANSVHTKLIQKINHATNRGLLKSRFYVINHTTVPAILVEICFISNPSERDELVTPQRKQATAEGIAEGIIEYLENQK